MSELGPTAANQRAFISLYDKAGLVPIAQELVDSSWQLSSSGGTAAALRDANLPVTDVETITGWPDMFDGRVKTLHPKVHGGLLADLSNPRDVATMEKHGIKPIHLLWGNLYPFELELANPNATDASIMEKIDIGGSALMRAAVKGRRLVLTHPDQNQEFLDRLHNNALDDPAYVRELAGRAFYESARYESLIMQYLGGTSFTALVAKKHADVKYGENPYMTPAALYADNRVNPDPLGLDQFRHVKGWEQSFINTTDMDSLVQTATHIAAGFERNFGEVPPMAIGVKHGNACGAGVAETLVDAVKKMLEGDTRAIFGGVTMVNGTIDKEVAEALMHHAMDGDGNRILDGVVGAYVTEEALEILSRKKLRVVVNPALANLNEASIDTGPRLRPVRGGVLKQPNYDFIQDLSAPYMQTHGEVSELQKRDLILAWAIGSTSNSNTITLVKDGKLLGNGVGQQDRVGASQLAISRTTINEPEILITGWKNLVMRTSLNPEKLVGAVAYSDSFFPFADGPMLLAKAGVKAILTSSGSVNDSEVIEALTNSGVSVVMVPDKIGRGFAKH